MYCVLPNPFVPPPPPSSPHQAPTLKVWLSRIDGLGYTFLVNKIVRNVFSSLSTGYKYHAFIIFNTSDCEEFVKNILIPTLERHYFKYCIHWKDWVPGEVITKNIVNSVYNSFKIIALVSKNFVTSNPCIYELDQAEHRLMNEHDDCLILFKLDDVEIPSTLLNRSYIDFTKATDISTWESKLVDVLKKAEVVEDESLYSEGRVNNNLSADNSELICSCQTVNEVLSMEEVIHPNCEGT